MSTTRRRPLRRVALLVVPVLVGATGLSACGVSDEQPRPGLAASVDGTDISLDRVDDATTRYCDYVADDPASAGQAIPRSVQRQQVAVTFILQTALEHILDDRDLDVTADYQARAADLRTQIGDQPDSGPLYDILEANTYVNVAIEALGADEGTDSGDGSDGADPSATPPGLTLAYDWLRENDVEINPVVGLDITDEGLVNADGDDLSVAVSDEAKAAVLSVDDPDVQAKIESLVQTLPAEQVCGGV